MRKTLTMVLAAVMLFSVAAPAMAMEIHSSEVVMSIENAELYAYMDINSADESTQERILAARSVIIYSTSWVADDVDGCVKDEDGNVIEVLPHFSEIFPSDWEIPVCPSTDAVTDTNVSPYAWSNSFNGIVHFYRPPTNGVPEPFHTLTTVGFAGTAYEYHVSKINTVAYNTYGTYNLEYRNADTQTSMGYRAGLESGNYFEINPRNAARVSIHGSTNDAVGEWSVYVMVDRSNVNS